MKSKLFASRWAMTAFLSSLLVLLVIPACGGNSNHPSPPPSAITSPGSEPVRAAPPDNGCTIQPGCTLAEEFAFSCWKPTSCTDYTVTGSRLSLPQMKLDCASSHGRVSELPCPSQDVSGSCKVESPQWPRLVVRFYTRTLPTDWARRACGNSFGACKVFCEP